MTNETDLPARFGVALDQIRAMRKGLSEGPDWIRKDRAILYTPEGLERLASALQVPNPFASEKKEGAAILERRVLFVKRKVTNPKILMAVGTEGEVRGVAAAIFRVRVRDASMFIPGNRLEPCRHVQADLWAFEGVAPRRRGRV